MKLTNLTTNTYTYMYIKKKKLENRKLLRWLIYKKANNLYELNIP